MKLILQHIILEKTASLIKVELCLRKQKQLVLIFVSQ